jgi:hypothetical protein
VRDYELGLEWQPIRHLNLRQRVIADRTFEDSALKQQATRNLLRLQAQFNFEIYNFSNKNIRSS